MLIEVVCALVRVYGVEIYGYLGALTRDTVRTDELFSIVCDEARRADEPTRLTLYRLAWRALVHPAPRVVLPVELELVVRGIRERTMPLLRTEIDPVVAELREHLEVHEMSMLILHLDRRLSRYDIALVMSGEHDPLDARVVGRRLASIKAKLRALIAAHRDISQASEVSS